MNWPLSQDFNEAIQNPRVVFADPDLKSAQPIVGAQGLPLPRSGNFADVYQLRGADGREWAVKCFTRPVVGLGDRYARVSEALARAKLPFTVEFTFLAEGVRVGDAWRPVVKMDWVEGLQLNQVVRENAARPTVLAALLQMWSKLAKRLREAGIAHADLQHGNVLLVPGSRPGAYGLKLIDYDGMYIPALANQPSGEVGHPAYQHPTRTSMRAYSLDVDRFPHLAIATAMKGLEVVGRGLWERYDTGDNLVFTEDDFRAPASSRAMQELWRTDHPAVQAFVGRLAISCTRPIPQTPWLDQIAPDGEAFPLTDEERRQAAVVLGVAEPVPHSSSPHSDQPIPLGDLDFDDRPTRPQAQAVQLLRSRATMLALLIGGVATLLLAGVVAGVVLSRGGPGSSETAIHDNTDEVKPKDVESKPDDGTVKKNETDPPQVEPKNGPSEKSVTRSFEPNVRPPVGKLEVRESWSFVLDDDPVSAKLVCSADSRTVVAVGGSKRPTIALELATGMQVPGASTRTVVPLTLPMPLADGRFAIDQPGSNSVVRIWDVETGRIITASKPFSFPERIPGISLISPNAEYVAFAGNRRTEPAPFRLKHIPTDRTIIETDLVNGRVFFTADSSRVLIAEATGKCRWFKLPQGEPDGEWEIPGLADPSRSLGLTSMSGDGTLLVFDGRLADRPESYHLIDARNGSVQRSFAGTFVARSADLSRDGRLFVAQRFDSKKRSGSAEIFDTSTGKVVAEITPPEGNSSIVPHFVPDGSAVVALVSPKPGAAQSIVRYDLVPEGKEPPTLLSPSGGSTWTVQIPPTHGYHFLLADVSANRVVVGGSRGGFTVLDLKSGRPRNGIPELNKAGISGLFRMQDGRFATIDSRMDRIRHWDASTGKNVGDLTVPEIPPGAGQARFVRVYPSPNGKFLAVARGGIPASDNPEVPFQVYEASTSRLLFSTTWKGGSAHFTGDSARLLVAEWSGRFRWFKLPSGESDGGWDLGTPPQGRRHVVHGLSANGSILAYNGPAGSKDGSSMPGVLDGRVGRGHSAIQGAFSGVGTLHRGRWPPRRRSCVESASTTALSKLSRSGPRRCSNRSTSPLGISCRPIH